MLQRKAARPRNIFDSNQKSDVRIANCHSLEIVVVRSHQVEEGLASIAVEDHLATTGALNHNRLVRRPALGEVVSPVEQISECQISGTGSAVHMVESVSDVKASMHHDDVTRLNARRV